jgi:hypothetical protein
MMKAVRTSETWVYFFEATRRHIPEGQTFKLSAVRTLNLTKFLMFVKNMNQNNDPK